MRVDNGLGGTDAEAIVRAEQAEGGVRAYHGASASISARPGENGGRGSAARCAGGPVPNVAGELFPSCVNSVDYEARYKSRIDAPVDRD